MKVALAQIDTTVGAVPANLRLCLDRLERARSAGADLVVLPELALVGYPPRDLLEHRSLIDANLRALDELAAATSPAGSPGVLVGYVERRAPSEGREGKGLYNAAALIDAGRVVSRHFKSLLPTYDVFDELRHFHPAESVRTAEFRGRKLGIAVCEDFWNDRLYWKSRSYPFDPVEELARQGAEILVTISASPYALGKPSIRAEMYSTATRRYGLPLVHVNSVGGNDELVFDGQSNVWGANGRLIAQAAAFEEDFLLAEIEPGATGNADYRPLDADEQIYRALTLGVRDYVRKNGFEKTLIGLSGGIDSALTATIAADALGPENVLGVSMPSRFSSDHSRDDAAKLAENLGVEYRVVPIAPVVEAFETALEPMFRGLPFGLAEENLQARARGNLLMTISNKFGRLVLTTGNKSELAVGYCTLYGDMSGGLAVLSDVLKTRVWSLSRWVNRDRERIPRSSIDKPPSAELRPDQLDTDSLPPYEILDPIVEAYVEGTASVTEIVAAGADEALVRRIARMIDRNEYKRQQAAVGLKVTGKAFGMGRRMPIARGDWEEDARAKRER